MSGRWPKAGIPKDYLETATRLVRQPVVTKGEFVALCTLAVHYIDTGQVPLMVRSSMALYIGSLWFRHENISESSLLSEIGGQFAEWDIPGNFDIENKLERADWELTKRLIREAQEKYLTDSV